MEQALFDASIIGFYCSRFQYDSFESFWHAKSTRTDESESRLADLLFSKIDSYPKDDLLRTQMSQACLELEKFWYKKYGISHESFRLFSGIKSQADAAWANAQILEETTKKSSQNIHPETRVDKFLKYLGIYDSALTTLNLENFDEETKIHYFLSDIDESLSSSFRYSGSVLKVLEQDSYIQNDHVTWGRWTLFRDATGFVDTWIVRIEDGRAAVVKIISKLAHESYVLDEMPKVIQFDSEIFKAIDKTSISAFENSELYTTPPNYFQMISMLEALRG
jgi:hypothetical protein